MLLCMTWWSLRLPPLTDVFEAGRHLPCGGLAGATTGGAATFRHVPGTNWIPILWHEASGRPMDGASGASGAPKANSDKFGGSCEGCEGRALVILYRRIGGVHMRAHMVHMLHMLHSIIMLIFFDEACEGCERCSAQFLLHG